MNDSPASILYDSAGANAASVKAASTAAAATDTSLVVGLSPNSPLPAGANTIGAVTVAATPDTVATATLAAANAAATVVMAGQQTVGFQLAAGTLIGTLVAEASFDNSNWFATLFDVPATSAKQATIVYSASNTATSATIVGAGGAGYVRVRVSAYTSGTATATMRASSVSDPSVLFTGPSGSPLPPDAVFNAGSDGTTLRALLTDTTGRLQVNAAATDGSKATYSAAAVNMVPVTTTPTDVFTITGSATKTIRVLRVTVEMTQSTGGTRDVVLIRRSTANSAGTSTAVVSVPHDSSNAAATATVLAYTANPTLGTTVGTVRASKLYTGTITGTGDVDDVIWDFGTRPGQAIVLRGTSQVLAVNLNSVAGAGNVASIVLEFTEES